MLKESLAVKLDGAYIILPAAVTQRRNECLNPFGPECSGIIFTEKSER